MWGSLSVVEKRAWELFPFDNHHGEAGPDYDFNFIKQQCFIAGAEWQQAQYRRLKEATLAMRYDSSEKLKKMLKKEKV